MHRHLTAATVATALLLVGASAQATTAPVPSYPFINVEQQSGIRYVSGGIGVCEREVLEQVARGFNLKLVFATADGHYLGDADILLKDERGRPLVETSSNGPLFYASLDPGTYTVEVSGLGRRYTEVARVTEARRGLTFTWPAEETAREPDPAPEERVPVSCG